MSNLQYVLLLGRNKTLSRTEVSPFCDEVFYDPDKYLLLAENLKFKNPREIPRAPEQLFLDRFGGLIRMGKVLGEFFSKQEMVDAMVEAAHTNKDIGQIHLGISQFGSSRDLTKELQRGFERRLKEKYNRETKLHNPGGQNLTSGRIFNDKLLKKGFEFIVWKNNNSFLLAQTVANQNLRNYTLRDRVKSFRDAKMGMLPPKLAQILINLSNPNASDLVLDPFCGSGTLNIEAAIMGYKTVGSDLNGEYPEKAKQNFGEMAEKFRYDTSTGDFFVGDAIKLDYSKYTGVIATEGFLGTNFEEKPVLGDIEKNEREILKLWEKFFQNPTLKNIHTIALCLPCWNYKGQKISIAQKLFAKIEKSTYTPQALFENQRTFVYEREDAHVGREICLLKKS